MGVGEKKPHIKKSDLRLATIFKGKRKETLWEKNRANRAETQRTAQHLLLRS